MAFLTDLAVAVHTHGVYPPGHPLRARTTEVMRGRAEVLLAGRPSVSLGVARRRLVVEGVATPEEHPLLSGLAERLHRMRVGAVTLHAGVTPGEIDALLLALAAEPERGQVVRPSSWPEGPHLRMHPLRFGGLQLADGETDGTGDREGATRAAQLWVGLAFAAMARGEAPDATEEVPEAHDVARAIETHPAAEAYDQVVVGYLLQLAEELKGDPAAGAAVRVRASRVVSGLSPETLRRLLEMGGDPGQRRRFVLNASRAFASPAVVRLVEAAAEASGQTISHSLLRMLQKLALYADRRGAPVPAADAMLEEQVRALVDGWSLDDPSPGEYTRVLAGFAQAAPRAPHDGTWPAEPERIVATALEADADGATPREALARMLGAGRGAEVVALLRDAPGEPAFAEAAWAVVASPDGLRLLLQDGRPDPAVLDPVLARMGAAAVPVLAEVMAESPSRVVRRVAFDRLAGMGAPAAEAAAALLGDERWFVVRNAVALLAETGAPAGVSAAPLLRHPDARVRREAYRLGYRMPGERTRALCLALADADAAAVRAALAEALGDCPPEAVTLVCRHAAAGGEPEARVLALRVLGTARDATALRTLIDTADGGRGWLGKRRLAAHSAALLAALSALAAGWPEHPAAADVLALARAAADPQVRIAAGGGA